MGTKGKPRKSGISIDATLSVPKLNAVPLKKRLEILFSAEIVPSRRQLALKYDLPEHIVHNILSYRKYILQNWQYNPEAERLLTKLELENSMAMTEILLEWKRRVQLNGLQITDAALMRKALHLKRILKANTLEISAKWWEQFNINWDYKLFHDSGDDSLELEDILNDIQWLFSQRTYSRLTTRFRLAKMNASAGRLKRPGDRYNNQEDLGIIDNEGDEDIEDSLNMSDIQAEPNYYNDDGYECEDYEFVLDEDVVFESLRKELENAEDARYQQYLRRLGDNHANIAVDDEEYEEHEIGNESLEVEEDQQAEEEEYEAEEDLIGDGGAEEEEDDVGIEEKQLDDEDTHSPIREEMLSPLPYSSADEGKGEEIEVQNEEIDEEVLMEERAAEQRIKEERMRKQNVFTTHVITTTPITQPRRKPRDLYTVPSLRKDQVRLNVPIDAAVLAKRQLLELMSESDDSDSETQMMNKRKRGRRKTYEYYNKKPRTTKINNEMQQRKILAGGITKTINPLSKVTRKNSTDFLPSPIHRKIVPEPTKMVTRKSLRLEATQSPTAAEVAEFLAAENKFAGKVNQTLSDVILHITDDEDNDGHSYLEPNNNRNANMMITTTTTTSTTTTTMQNNMNSKKNPNQMNILNKGVNREYKIQSGTDVDGEIILGGPFSYEDERLEKAAILAAEDAIAVEEKLSSKLPMGALPIRLHSHHGNHNRSLIKTESHEGKSEYNSQHANATQTSINQPKRLKRAKRRTDGSDLTLRKDKVRVNLAPLANQKTSMQSEDGHGNEHETIYETYVDEV